MLLSIVVASWLRLTVPSDQLFAIRTQQVFGLASIVLLYVAVLLTPLSKLAKNIPGMPALLFARRAIGVSAFYFAALHTIIVLVGQVGGWSGILLLPSRFKFAFILGGIALLILMLMAATSFDKAIKAMTFPRWKFLHRFVYLAGITVIIHVWLIGTHAQYAWAKWGGLLLLALLFLLEAIRLAQTYAVKYKLDSESRLAVGALIFGLLLGALLLLPLTSPNYHAVHSEGLHETH